MYLLDTHICIYLIKKKFEPLQNRVLQTPFTKLLISSISIAELEFGVAKSQFPQKNKEALMKFLAPFSILPFDDQDCEYFGIIRAYLQQKGTPIDPYDLQIASQCLSRDLTLITNNVGEFERIPNLNIENWTEVKSDL